MIEVKEKPTHSTVLNSAVEPCRIIGVLDDGPASLNSRAIGFIKQADLIIGGTRTLQQFADLFSPQAERRDLTGQLSQIPSWIQNAQTQGKSSVVLATGDPLCHGIAGYLLARLDHNACEIMPNISTIQLACARLGFSWQDMKICSVHSRDAGEWTPGAGPEHGLYELLRAASQHARIAIFTSPHNAPDRIARMLLQEGLGDELRMAVAEHLLQPDERIIINCSITEAAGRKFADPNIAFLWRETPARPEPLFGLSDDSYQQRHPEKGLITKREVRAVSLARMQLRNNSIVWDIGAGSGAVGLEAARLAVIGHVYAIEKNADDAANAAANRRMQKIHNYTLVNAKAPQGMETWPNPDAVFIGGSGGELAELITLCLNRLNDNGWLVMNFVTFENLSTAIETLKSINAEWDITQLQASRSRPILTMQRLAAENPVWIVCAQKGNTHGE